MVATEVRILNQMRHINGFFHRGLSHQCSKVVFRKDEPLGIHIVGIGQSSSKNGVLAVVAKIAVAVADGIDTTLEGNNVKFHGTRVHIHVVDAIVILTEHSFLAAQVASFNGVLSVFETSQIHHVAVIGERSLSSPEVTTVEILLATDVVEHELTALQYHETLVNLRLEFLDFLAQFFSQSRNLISQKQVVERSQIGREQFLEGSISTFYKFNMLRVEQIFCLCIGIMELLRRSHGL